MNQRTAQVHASAVAVQGQGCLITGASGTGKSALSFDLMALGAELIADDRVDLTAREDTVMLSCPDRLKGLIEARGIGLIKTTFTANAIPCALIVDLDRAAERMPPLQKRDLLGIPCPVINGAKRSGLASTIFVLLRKGVLLNPEQVIKP